jgi:hydroxymethylpyrimidine pyrophosphatase-like HAD family hydrolase
MQTNLNLPISELTADNLKNIKILCFDCDGVTVQKGTEIINIGHQSTIKTNKISDSMLQKIIKLKKHFHISFSSGRSMLYLSEMYGDVLWENASLQSEIGNFILYQGELIQNFKLTPYELEVIKNIRFDLKKLS